MKKTHADEKPFDDIIYGWFKEMGMSDEEIQILNEELLRMEKENENDVSWSLETDTDENNHTIKTLIREEAGEQVRLPENIALPLIQRDIWFLKNDIECL